MASRTDRRLDYVAILKEHDDRRARHDEVRRVLAAVDLTELGGRKIRKLSGGMHGRLLIAQALLGRPELLMLAEPPSAWIPSSDSVPGHRLRTGAAVRGGDRPIRRP
jgi:ABC-type glutathione transport system ATPase component